MTIKKLLLVLIVLVILNAFSVYAQVCGATITMSTTIAANFNCAGNGPRINTSNIVFDCNGFNITGSGAGYGILLNSSDNVTIKNCNVFNFTDGIYLNYSDNNTVYNCTTANNSDGFELYASNHNNLTQNFAYDNTAYGIRLQRDNDYNYLFDNTATRGGSGFYSKAGHNDYNTLMNNTAYNNPGSGFVMANFEYGNITNNIAYNNSGQGFLIGSFSDYNNISSNQAYNNSGDGFSFSNADYNNISDNIAYKNNLNCFDFLSCDHNKIFNNFAYNCQDYGFRSLNDFDNDFINNTAYDNNDAGFYMAVTGTGLRVINSTAYNNSGDGFCFADMPSFGTEIIHNNTAFNNSDDGFDFFNCDNANVTNNLAYDNSVHGIHIHNPPGGGPGLGINLSVMHNLIYNNSGDGIYLNNTREEMIFNNTAISNTGVGIHLHFAVLINITLNRVLNHTYSINLTNASNNGIYNNYFENLPFADNASMNNIWNIAKTLGTNIINGPYLGGNFWLNYNGTDLDNDGLGDTELPWKGLTNEIVNGGDNHPLTFIYVKNIQCEFNNSGTFLSCRNATFFANITRVRVNCTPLNGIVSNATFNLTNLFDANTFFVNTTSTIIGGYYVLDNPDVQILDSGNWTLDATCTNTSGAKRNGTSLFFIPFGNVSGSVVTPPGNTNVNNGTTFNVTCRMQCTGGECVQVNVTLDPLNPLTNLTQPTLLVHAVYADSQFIYGASNDSGIYVWNKTNLALFTVINTSMPNRAVFADSQYIYAGGVGFGDNLSIWNRTDLVTPFVHVTNLTPTGGVYGVKSDVNYIYAVGGIGIGPGAGPGFLSIYNKSTFASVKNFTYADIVRGIDIDSNFIYSVTHNCSVNITNISNFAFVASLPVPASCNQVKAISVDDNYIITTGLFSPFGPPFAWTRVYNKSNYAVLFDWNDTSRLSFGLAAGIGGLDFAYYGGATGGPPVNGSLYQLNKKSFVINDSINFSGWSIRGLYCDDDYLYAAAADWLGGNGMVMLFNNSCPSGPAPPPVVTINSLIVVPSQLPVPSTNVYCSANITTNGTIDTVLFNVTFPGGGSLLLNGTNIGGDIYNSSLFNVTVLGMHVCTVIANNTNGSSATRSRNFYGGNKGTIPMNSGSPFYTINQNPRYPDNQSCLNSSIPGQNCDTSWNVTVNGTAGQSWQFFCIYESGQSGDANTSRVNVTIVGGPPPPPPPTPGGGGGGGAARSWQQIEEELQEEVCIESWFCEPWGECEFGETTRTCVDLNTCGTTKNKPPEIMHCKVEEVVIEEPALLEEVKIGEIQQDEFKPTVVKGPEEKPGILTSRNALRAALLVIVLGALVYLFALSRFLRARAVKPKKTSMKEEKFQAKKALVTKIKPKASIKKPKPKALVKKVQPKKKPEKLPDTTKGLLDELNKL